MKYNLPEPIKRIKLQKLEGTEKQVSWAEKIRDEILHSLTNALKRTEDGRPCNAIEYMTSQEKMVEWIEQGRDEEHKQERYETIIYLAGCIERMYKIASIRDARFWIDNRTNNQMNYMNQKLIKEVMGK
jgi:hypothetical protein